MEILNSGSFINLENQEKIEQLIFTAQEIAKAALETDGFVNTEENNRRLAGEIWQGAEYMCRDFEEANIKNIFINNFLERLREIRGATGNSEITPQPFPVITKTIEKTDEKDEFLGIVETNKTQEPENLTDSFSSDEIEDKESLERDFLSEDSDVTDENEVDFAVNAETDEFLAVENIEENENSLETTSQSEVIQSPTIQSEVGLTVNNQKAAVSSIVLPEKEPYQFDKCTVTATIQLLPTEMGTRRVVLSVRTHDFAPQISVMELAGEVNPEHLMPALAKAFEEYKNDLPVKVIDKLKKEKSAVKKQSNKITAETKSSGVLGTTQTNIKTGHSSEVKAAEKTTSKVTIPKPENSLQGNLFG